MKILQQTLATILLSLVLGISAYAGDMGGPSSVNSPTLPTESIPANSTTLPPQVPGETDPPVLTELVLNFLVSAFTMY